MPTQTPPTFPFAASTIIDTRPNTIALKTDGYHKEALSSDSGSIYPGMIVVPQSDGSVIRHNVAGGGKPYQVVKEDALQGHWFRDAMASGDLVSTFIPKTGDIFLGLVDPSATAIVQGNLLMSAGDGTLALLTGSNGEVLYDAVGASAVITNTTVETAFNKSYTIPANFLLVGDIIRVRLQALAVATHSTDTLVLKLKIGSTVVVATGAVNVADNDVGVIEATLVVRTIGASGTFVANGQWNLGVPGTATDFESALGSTAIDTTATQAITVTATWSVADTGNQVRLDVLNVTLERAAEPPYNRPLVMALESVDNSANASTMAYVRVEVL